MTGVEKREVTIQMEIQKQAVDLDEKMFGVAAPKEAKNKQKNTGPVFQEKKQRT